MPISFVASAGTTSSQAATAFSHDTVLPSGIQSGDVIFLAVNRAHDYTLNTPTGYTLVRDLIDYTGSPPNAISTAVFYRIADGTETTTGPTFTTATKTRFIIQAAVYRGAYTGGAPLLAENGKIEAGSAAAHSTPPITNTATDAWSLTAFSSRQAASPQTWTAPTGQTERVDTDHGLVGSNNIWAEWNDSAGPIALGEYTYTATASTSTAYGNAWVGILRADTAATRTGSGSGSWAFAGAAVGSSSGGFGAAPFGTAPFGGPTTGTGTAAGSGSWSFTGSAVGSAPVLGRKGNGSGTWSFTGGAATGLRVPKATASGTFTFAGSAVGTAKSPTRLPGTVVLAEKVGTVVLVDQAGTVQLKATEGTVVIFEI